MSPGRIPCGVSHQGGALSALPGEGEDEGHPRGSVCPMLDFSPKRATEPSSANLGSTGMRCVQ